ncbi:MAG TPA: pyruvate dehydrogenase (acetyl-transferring) E1 component subunit alpha [Geminicoccaceae bacterium]|nr:pyruvate dehydrogenase (acetyl-transferring) E1 component subunit alpha [Geminicoccaceae bacterium]
MATAKQKPKVVPIEEVIGDPSGRPSAEELFELYREMLLIRRFEEKAGQLYGMGLIGGFCHLYIGQEAVAVGMQHALEPGDTVITAYRDHGHMLCTGMEPKRVMAELTGRATGYSKGKGGSMHMFAKEKGFFGGHGIVGTTAPLGTGLAFAHNYREDGGATLCYFGDGATNQGQVYEAFNMASLWKLPIVYCIENNKYGMGTSVERASATTELYRRGEAFGIPGEQVDGMDVLAVKQVGGRVLEHVRSGKGPYVVEALTYRYRGHSMSDPAKYRTRDEVQDVRSHRDPIERLRKLMIEEGLADEDRFKEIDREIRAIVNDAAAFAQDSPEPDPSELWTDVYVEA